MVRYEAIQTLRAKIFSRIESLRQEDAPIDESLNRTVALLDGMKPRLFLDLPGEEAHEKWAALPDADKTDLQTQMQSIDGCLDALERKSRSLSKPQKFRLLVYAGVLPIALFVPLFLCICKRALPPPIQTKRPAVQSAPAATSPESDVTPAPTGTEDTKDDDAVDDDVASAPSTAAQPGKKDGTKSNDPSNAHSAWVFLAIFCLGAIGGCLRLIGSAVTYFGKRKFYRSWLPYYYYAPLEGGLLAFIVCLLVPSRIVPVDSATVDTSTPIFIYALAAFSGLFAKNVLRKLKDVTDALFGAASKTDAA